MCAPAWLLVNLKGTIEGRTLLTVKAPRSLSLKGRPSGFSWGVEKFWFLLDFNNLHTVTNPALFYHVLSFDEGLSC